jgi:hypothetical protein
MTDELIEALREGLSARADSGRAPGMQRYMKSEMPFFGVPSPGVDAVVSADTRNCPETATKLPAGGHENCPLTVMGSARHDVVCLAAVRG